CATDAHGSGFDYW
nr:immunoglobulin heavy chain junction region [Macaca mulatta]MOV35824.1 immunoglobulin heavy chain junction region [Macaca mulatta]MOV35975.1 immunoglobulin heavy chain junction region [Macaca mulatta]MOV36055.1 immunoglobulin heavy chain junction region [Macaca mulatta]MOV36064.1 immunoglobulin heavy chain junction region [Macaca mulatta]